MTTSYDRIAGHSVERLAALSDGIFAVAMTLLVLDLHVPADSLVHNETDLWQELVKLSPQLLVYLMSFVTLGTFWVGQQTQLNHLKRSDRHLTWIHLGFLFAVTLVPFTTRLLADYMEYRAALIIYWLNIVLLGALIYASWGRVTRTHLGDVDLSLAVKTTVCRRIIFAQTLYAIGAALCIFSTYLSVAAIMLVQLNYVLAPATWNWRRAPG